MSRFRVYYKVYKKNDVLSEDRTVEINGTGGPGDNATRGEIKDSLAFDHGVGPTSVELTRVVGLDLGDDGKQKKESWFGTDEAVTREEDRKTTGNQGLRPPQKADIMSPDRNRNELLQLKNQFGIDDKTIPANLNVPDMQKALADFFYPEVGGGAVNTGTQAATDPAAPKAQTGKAS